MAIKRYVELIGGGTRGCQRYGQNGVGAEAGFVVGTVERDHRRVHRSLVQGVHADHGFGDFIFDVRHRFEHAFAAIAALVAVAQFNRFPRAGGRAGRRGGQTLRAGGQSDLRLNRGIASRIQNFLSNYKGNFRHC